MKAYFVVVETQVSDFGLEPLAKAKAKGYSTVFCTNKVERYNDIPSYSSVMAEVDHLLEFDTNDPGAIIDELKRNSISPIAGIVTICDYSLGVVAKAARELGLPSLSPIAAENCRDKLKMRESCQKKGVDIPSYLCAETFEEAIGFATKVNYPVVVKPMTDSASVGVTLCWSPDEIKVAFTTLNSSPVNIRGQRKRRGVLIEEYMLGLEVSVESILVKGERHFYGVTDKNISSHPYFVEIGDTFPSQLPDQIQDECIRTAKAALEAVGHDFGVSHVELKITKSGVKVVEVNGRVAGNEITNLVSLSTGIDLLDCQVALSLGREPSYRPTQKKAAASTYFTSQTSGIIKNISGVDLARSTEGVVKLEVYLNKGDHVQTAKSNHDILGTVVVQSSSSAMARRLADTAAIQIRFETQ